MKMKNTRRTLLLSMLSLLLCVSMLVGSTFAWFTDSVVSANNIIKSGNLDVVLEYKTNWSDEWAEVKADTKLFAENAKFEPGYTEVVFLRVSNAGSLALKYEMKVDILSETTSTNMAGEEFKLSDYLEIGTYTQSEYNDGNDWTGTLPFMFGTREAALSSVSGNMQKLTSFKLNEGVETAILPGEKTAQIAVLVLNMPETVGNEANHKTGVEAPKINLGVTLLATQLVHENDSFDNMYDEVTLVTNAEELKSALAEGKKPVLPDGSVYEEPEEAIVVWNTTDLTDALKKANNDKTVFLAAGEFTLPQITKTDVKNITVVGTSLANVAGMTSYKTNNFNSFTFENITFTKDVKGHFSGNCVFKNCDFTAAGIAQSSNVAASATLTIENCTFNGTGEKASLHFGGKDGGTIIVKKCVFNKGGTAFGKAMNITFEDCDFNGTAVECYGSHTLNNCTFDADALVYIRGITGATEVNLTMNGCSVDGGADVTSVCYDTGNANGGIKTITIDGTVYNHDELQPFPTN